MEKIAIVVKNGMIKDVYGTPDLYQADVEIIDLDTADPDEENTYLDRLQMLQQYLRKLY